MIACSKTLRFWTPRKALPVLPDFVTHQKEQGSSTCKVATRDNWQHGWKKCATAYLTLQEAPSVGFFQHPQWKTCGEPVIRNIAFQVSSDPWGRINEDQLQLGANFHFNYCPVVTRLFLEVSSHVTNSPQEKNTGWFTSILQGFPCLFQPLPPQKKKQ